VEQGIQATPFLLKIYCILYFKILFLYIYKCAWKPAFLKSSHISWTRVVVHNRDHPGKLQNTTIYLMHAKNHLWRQWLAQKSSQTFFSNASVQQNIIKSISNSFFDFQWLAKLPISPYSYSYFLVLWVIAKLKGYLALKPT